MEFWWSCTALFSLSHLWLLWSLPITTVYNNWFLHIHSVELWCWTVSSHFNEGYLCCFRGCKRRGRSSLCRRNWSPSLVRQRAGTRRDVLVGDRLVGDCLFGRHSSLALPEGVGVLAFWGSAFVRTASAMLQESVASMAVNSSLSYGHLHFLRHHLFHVINTNGHPL